MRDRFLPIRRFLGLLLLVPALCLTTIGASRADVFGRLKITVKNADDEKPIASAKLVLKDSAGVRPNVSITTDTTGVVITPDLEARAWTIVTDADGFQNDTRQATVATDTVTEVEVLLEPLKEKTVVIHGQKDVVHKGDTSDSKQRDQTFIKTFPTNAGNPQSLTQVVAKSAPGLVLDSNGQAHPRGEHSSTSLYIDAFGLQGVLQGRYGPTLSPEVIQSLNVLTGGYAPEYGGELAAVLNASLRAGTIRPQSSLLFQGGEFNTFFGNLSASGQGGPPIAGQSADGEQARRFGYFLNFNGRTTDNALEPPQPDDQTAHNHGEAQTYFGNFGYDFSSRDNVKLTLNAAPAYSQVANRTGLPDSFASVGQGFGYAGHLSAADAAAQGIVSQQVAGQDDYQRDENEFGALNWRHTFNDQLSGLFSVGLVRGGLDILNHNPAIDLSNLPMDNSIEFNPTIHRQSHAAQVQGSLTLSRGSHIFKGGLLTDEQSSIESYNLIPASQLATDALGVAEPRLLPPGSVITNMTDSLGNPIVQLPANPVSPTLSVNHTGFYRAAYVQDTWTASRRFTMNYGLRLDWYHADVTLAGATNSLDTAHLSPRLNMAYVVAPRTIGRLSYNRLFTQPPLSQAATLGLAIPPQTGDLYEGSIERQMGPGQSLKLDYYYKDWRNFADTGLLIPGTQLGVYTTFSHPHVNVRGFEMSYDLTPRNNVGLGSYVTWANAVNHLLLPETGYTDHDQLNTIGFGLAYTWANQANVGLSLYHGSGVSSSTVFGSRTPRTVVNLALATKPNLFGGSAQNGRGGLALSIENLFDDRSVINFQSAFSGTRFQQGRRILLSANTNF